MRTIYRYLFLLLIASLSNLSVGFAQTKITTYHDSAKSVIKEVYFILDNDSSQIDGVYQRFDRTGNVFVKGQFIKGIKEGKFIEYYPDGAEKRHISFKQDLREGPFTVFSPNGTEIQKGHFASDTLSGELIANYGRR